MISRKNVCRLGLALVAAFAMASCGGPKLSGTYKGALMSFSFESNGKVLLGSSFTPGLGIECDYKIEGDKIKITNAQEQGVTYVLTLQKDGTILGPAGETMTKDADTKANK